MPTPGTGWETIRTFCPIVLKLRPLLDCNTVSIYELNIPSDFVR